MIAYAVGSSGQTLVLTDPVLSHFDCHRQLASKSRESGGQLFARIDETSIVVERATGPRPTDRRSFLSFVPDRMAERREIGRYFKAGLHYVGDWHTHPEPNPRPSKTDIRSFRNMFRRSRHQLAGFVMVIVGTADAPEGLYVGVSDSKRLEELKPQQI